MKIEPFDIHDKDDISQQAEVYRIELMKRGYSGEKLEKHILMRMQSWKRSRIPMSLERRSTFLGKVRGNFLFGQKLID